MHTKDEINNHDLASYCKRVYVGLKQCQSHTRLDFKLQ